MIKNNNVPNTEMYLIVEGKKTNFTINSIM